ncbi:MAG TPA: nucleotidyltransferase family protein [Chitinophagaceae bacterium]|nr:nucleotidyltransferase family protein [Chitinophagaceae bacterium]
MTAVQTGIVVLAAGSSARLGRPKQSLLYQGQTLLQKSIAAAMATNTEQVLVVLGATGMELEVPPSTNRLHYMLNTGWQEGMASSIRCGVKAISTQWPEIENVLLMACDQPFVNSEVLDKLVTLQRQTGSLVVASKYRDVAGIPAIFNKALFPALLQLKGDTGAKKIIAAQQERIAWVDFPLGDIDIDTSEDYLRLQKP